MSAKRRGQRKSSRGATTADAASAYTLPAGIALYHGGVPGLEAEAQLRPAKELKLAYTYTQGGTVYDPALVYLTTDLQMARLYASQYLDGSKSFAGDVYAVEPVGSCDLDPDYSREGNSRGVFLRCKRARVLGVVERAVEMESSEQARAEAPYLRWEVDRPVYDESGLIFPSQQMLANGVTRSYTEMLRPWLRLHEIGGAGQLLRARHAEAADQSRLLLEDVPLLDNRHAIKHTAKGFLRRRAMFICATCQMTFKDQLEAAHHQLDKPVLQLVRQFNPRVNSDVSSLSRAAAVRKPERWTWTDL